MGLKDKITSIPGYNTAVLPYHHFAAFRAASKYNYPANDMTIIGVTGTNGKTTTSFMIFNMLKEAGLPVGLMTTVAWGSYKELHPQVSHMTTAGAGLLNKRISELKEQGVKYLVLETTSHALAQGRVFGIPVEIAVFTNLTHEHLDYHKTMKNYAKAKAKLFKKAKFSVFNADDEWATKIAVMAGVNPSNYTTYGIKKGDLQAKAIKLKPNGVSYTVDDMKIKTQIPGEFNIYNSLAAVAVGKYLKLSKKQIEQGISSLAAVEGRMTRIPNNRGIEVIVDFAHTPDSFEKLLSDLRKSTSKRLLVLFGSAGRRDEAKRYTQGEIAGKYADEIVLTEEDDRDCNGNEILNQIEQGVLKSTDKKPYKILDRTNAIKKILSLAKTGDTVILLGKGHEKTIERADGEHPWDEIKLTKKLLK